MGTKKLRCYFFFLSDINSEMYNKYKLLYRISYAFSKVSLESSRYRYDIG